VILCVRRTGLAPEASRDGYYQPPRSSRGPVSDGERASKRSGLPFAVYISEKQGRHDVRVKVAAQFVASVGLRPKVEIVEGNLSTHDFDLVRQWIELNRDVIIGYWDRDIEDTGDAIALLKPLPKG
jgi:Domain of unknown function (DUF4160)